MVGEHLHAVHPGGDNKIDDGAGSRERKGSVVGTHDRAQPMGTSWSTTGMQRVSSASIVRAVSAISASGATTGDVITVPTAALAFPRSTHRNASGFGENADDTILVLDDG